MSTRKFCKTFIAAAVLFLVPVLASAHTLKTEADIGALFHVDPNDQPVAGRPAIIFVELQDTAGQLTTANCLCDITISIGGKEFFRQPLYQPGDNSLSVKVPYTFPSTGIYDIRVSRPESSTNPGFSLVYPVQVSPAPALPLQPQKTSHTAHYVIFGLGVAFLIAYLLYNRKSNKQLGN